MNTRRTFRVLGPLLALPLCLSLAWTAGQTKSAFPAAQPPAGSYQVDPVHSTILFRIKHLNTSWAYGRFNQVKGSFTFDAAKPETSTVSLEIGVDSVDTNAKKRDDHLKSPDFFDAVQFPTATFKSTSVKKTPEGKYAVSGELNLHGVKKPLTVDFEEIGSSDTQMAGVRVGFHGVLSLKRSDFGIEYMPDALGDDVQLTVSIEGMAGEGKAK